MTFNEILAQVLEQLQREGRVSYRALKRQFALDDEYLEDLKTEIIDAKRLASDEDAKVLVWTGASLVSGAKFQVSGSQPPISYTPPHLADRIRAMQAAMEARGITDGERRIITAVFTDMAGFTALAHGLDPEVVRAIIDPALQVMMNAVHRYEGFVTQSLGDGIFALFGAPIAHEDHPQRALYAALLMQEEMRRYSDKIRLEKGVPIQIRVGINTGEVVLRSIRKDDLHTDYLPVGHSTNLASRMEGLATPGSIVVSENTYKLIEGYFECKALGAVQVKGLDEPVNIYEVLGVGPLRTRLQVAARRGLSRFVGRQSELEQLKKALEQARAGHGQVAGVMGEPGVGKSRLFYEFKLLSQQGCLVLEAFSVSHGKAYAYLPLVDLLKNYFQITPQDTERKRQEKITGTVLTLDRSLEDTLPYLFALLGIAEPISSLHQMDPQIRKQRTLDAIKRLLVRESLNQPLILIFEDLHWLDSETQAFLDLLTESIATARILVLVNYRPEYRHEWGNKTFYTQLRLDPLGQDDAQELLTALLGNDSALRPLKQLILAKTEGNPFFMEEIVQTLFEEGVLVRDPVGGAKQASLSVDKVSPTPPDLHLPPTVQAVLAARIDRLGVEEKALLQTLSVLGKEFPWSLLKQVVDQPEDTLHRLLAHLQAAEFIYEQLAFPEVEYTFKHALTQEVAYASLPQDRRKVLHERTAQTIEALFHSRLEDHYNDLAHHYTRSGNTPKAVQYLHLAGQQAVQRSANAEAISHLTAALDLLKTLPDTPERAQQELTLQTTLGPALIVAKGWGAPEVAKTYTRARELCQQVGDTPQHFPVLWGLWISHSLRAEHQVAYELAEQLLRLAQSGQDSAALLCAHRVMGESLFNLGEFAPARAHLEQSIALYHPQQHQALVSLYGEALDVTCRSLEAWWLWFLGYPNQALRRSDEALTVAQQRAHPFSLAYARGMAAALHQYRREGQAVQEQVKATMAIAAEQGFPYWVVWGTILQGWALVEQGKGQEGIAQIQQGMAAYPAVGAEIGQPYLLALLAEAHGKEQQTAEGLNAVTEALARIDKSGERCYEAELYRLKGQLTLQSKTSLGQVSGKSQASLRQVSGKSRTSPRQVEDQSQASHGQVADNAEDANTQHPTPNTQAEVEREAEECFHKAIEIARRQQAKSLELRAVMSLARLWKEQGKKDEARQMLAEIYGWFTEGFDTADLQEAKALLEELNH
jgi:class 3 adenylate cyclase/predicted ATPase